MYKYNHCNKLRNKKRGIGKTERENASKANRQLAKFSFYPLCGVSLGKVLHLSVLQFPHM